MCWGVEVSVCMCWGVGVSVCVLRCWGECVCWGESVCVWAAWPIYFIELSVKGVVKIQFLEDSSSKISFYFSIGYFSLRLFEICRRRL